MMNYASCMACGSHCLPHVTCRVSLAITCRVQHLAVTTSRVIAVTYREPNVAISAGRVIAVTYRVPHVAISAGRVIAVHFFVPQMGEVMASTVRCAGRPRLPCAARAALGRCSVQPATTSSTDTPAGLRMSGGYVTLRWFILGHD